MYNWTEGWNREVYIILYEFEGITLLIVCLFLLCDVLFNDNNYSIEEG
jgi:hypothetical protein